MEIKVKQNFALSLKVTLLIYIIYSSSTSAISENSSSLNKQNQPDCDVKRMIQSEDGDIIDCVDIYKQPAFNHPALKHHKIQMAPSFLTSMEDETSETVSKRREQQSATQIWQRSGSCPDGTIPILRREKMDGRPNRIRKQPSVFVSPRHQAEQFGDDKELRLIYENRSVAIVLAQGFAFYGGKGDLMVWNPHVEEDDEYSMSLVALKSGPLRKPEVVESGWIVNPSLYGDRKTRFFLYWTADGSVDTGCFDLTCPGFVQTTNEIALGAAIFPISNPNGLPSEITITILKDPKTRNWWVIYGEKTKIGYWPGKLFQRLFYHAQTVHWGGEVYSSRMGTHPHPATAMGNGRFPDFIFRNAGTVSRMRVAANSQRFSRPEMAFSFTDEYRCYNVIYRTEFISDPEVYYGGPGRSYQCL